MLIELLGMELDPESEQVREVYAHFGLAVFMSDVLTKGVVFTLAAVELLPIRHRRTKTDYDKYVEALHAQTFGQLVRRLQGLNVLPLHLSEQLEESLKARNFLVHRYFWERAVAFTNSAGREKMLVELAHHRDLFKSADVALDAFRKPLEEAAGVTADVLEGEMRDLIAEDDFGRTL